MKAIILAAGYGTRLYPITENTAKSLLHVGKKPMINYVVERIIKVKEVDEILVVTNDRFYNDFITWKNMQNYPIKIEIINDGTKSNDERLGAAGDILFVLNKTNINDWTLIVAGDNLFGFDLNEMVDLGKDKSSSVIALIKEERRKIANKLGNVKLKLDLVVKFEEKPENPETNIAATACYLFSPKDIKLIRKDLSNKKFNNSGNIMEHLVKKSKLYGVVYEEFWYDIGTKEEYLNVRQIFG